MIKVPKLKKVKRLTVVKLDSADDRKKSQYAFFHLVY